MAKGGISSSDGDVVAWHKRCYFDMPFPYDIMWGSRQFLDWHIQPLDFHSRQCSLLSKSYKIGLSWFVAMWASLGQNINRVAWLGPGADELFCLGRCLGLGVDELFCLGRCLLDRHCLSSPWATSASMFEKLGKASWFTGGTASIHRRLRLSWHCLLL